MRGKKKMSRLSFRPRPLDIHKKLPIVKSVKDFEDDDTPTSATRNSQMLRLVAVEVDNEVPFSFTLLLCSIILFFIVFLILPFVITSSISSNSLSNGSL